jgi:hypothetical protein
MMIKRIKVKMDIIEMMLYYWQSTAEKEKVGESFLREIADVPEMKYIYDDEFSGESVRKVLSAISNRELLNNSTKKERKFWNNNMWMLEDLEFMNMMVSPVKTLNLDSLLERLNEKESKYEALEVVFIPGHENEYTIDENKLIINFFKITVDLYEEGKVTIAGKPFKEYIEEKLIELISQ